MNVLAFVFIITQNWKHLKHPSTRKWIINKLWYIYTIKWYSAIKSKELLLHARTWMNFKNIILNEILKRHKSLPTK